MMSQVHLSDEKILAVIDGELPRNEAAQADSHLATCWTCRTRKQELEAAIGHFVRFYGSSIDDQISSADGPRALLRAQLKQAEAADQTSPGWLTILNYKRGWISAVAVLLIAIAVVFMRNTSSSHDAATVPVTLPNRSLTPGATVAFSQPEVCQQTNLKNKPVSRTLQKAVFAEYGISGAEPELYEVDYLITPALGGADDIHNLWPESNQTAGWNAQVKDALEDHLRKLVCEGHVNLQTAQRDIATNWIEAYKKYFHTDHPLAGY